MAKTILGISAFYHDSAAAIVRDGEIIAAAQEERFTRKRHDQAFPKHAIDFCLKEAGIRAEDLSYVCFYDKPLKKFDRILETYFAYAPSGFGSFRRALPLWLKEKLFVPREIKKGLDKKYTGPIVFCDHHESHAASAFFPSPYDRAAILTSDGVGEWATTTWGVGEATRSASTRPSASRTRWASSTARSLTSPASRSTPASTSSWASRRTASPCSRTSSRRS